jgi:hypothetical protein
MLSGTAAVTQGNASKRYSPASKQAMSFPPPESPHRDIQGKATTHAIRPEKACGLRVKTFDLPHSVGVGAGMVARYSLVVLGRGSARGGDG